MQDFEKLGVFYLGREYDLGAGVRRDNPVLYDSRDLLTHAVAVGMTGSGKTGLCLGLIEEAALDGVPVIAIDPKGDLGNLLLTFPALTPSDFRPWIDEEEARRAGKSADDYAAEQARAWAGGLSEWGQDGGRIDRLKKAADVAIYTPGSQAGLPVSILSSFMAPPEPVRSDRELLAERASNTATSVLGLADVDAPPRSREHTLLSALFANAWSAGQDLDLAALIQQVQKPPLDRIGIVDVDAFFPSRERFELAMRFNSVLASPGFEHWFEGEALDPARLLHSADGRPRVSIFSIAHLGDAERMFFVSLLLNQVLAWTRAQPGTGSLRAVLYMDEIAGYFPPVANPPSKPPLLLLLKQARAFGLGVVLATQNPVDLDYRALGNIGTWFLGRLQTEQDKARVLDGLEGAAAGAFDRAEADRLLSALRKRLFLLHNVHDEAPIVFETRWTMSYLRGPLTREQIRTLMGARRPTMAENRTHQPTAPPARQGSPLPVSPDKPVLPPGISEFFIPPAPGEKPETYAPVLLGGARVAFTDTKLGVDATREVVYSVPFSEGAVTIDWNAAARLPLRPANLSATPAQPGVRYEPIPSAASQAKNYAAWQKAFARHLAAVERVELFSDAETRLTSKPEESEGEFRVRVQHARRAARDEAVDAVRRKYATKQATLAERLRRAEAAVDRETEQASQQKLQTAVSFGATVLGALFGRKAVSTGTLGRATTAARGVGRSMKEAEDVKRAADSVDAIREQARALEAEIRQETEAIAASFSGEDPFERVVLAPKRGHVDVQFVALGWEPR